MNIKKVFALAGVFALATLASLAATACAKNKDFDPSRNISFVAREDGSGTKTAFMEIIGLRGRPDPRNAIIQTGTAGVLAEVRGNPAALAYESLGYVTDDAKVLMVDGVEASVENIKNGTYGIARPLSVVYREASLNTSVNRAFLTFLQSSNAQAIITEDGYVSVANNAAEYRVDASLSGTVSISGSTSLQPLMIKLANEFERLQPGTDIHVSGGGSGTGYKNAVAGVSVFGMIAEEFGPEKAPGCVHYMVCKDGIAVIVNMRNPLNNITIEQLRNIVDRDAGAQAITRWSQLVTMEPEKAK
jgi:phosphate transport system substrate-binding protein